jgi:DNA-directed RNA polymerase subunit beta'
MARLSPEEGFEILKDRVSGTVKDLFPIVGKKNTLEIQDVGVKDGLHIDDIRSQKKAKLNGRTWAVPVEATVTLKDNVTGKKVDEKKIRLFNLPKTTRRYSQIVDGQEYQVDNQWRLKSGVYARVKDNGELESSFNLAKGRGFSLGFEPKDRKFVMKYGTSNIPLQPLLREMGVSQDKIQEQWGSQIAESNVQDREKALVKFFKASTGNKATNVDEARQHFLETMEATELRPDTTKVTLGTGYKRVSAPALMDASSKLLKVSKGEAEPDARDALMFKELHSTEDFFAERIRKGSGDIMRRIKNTLDKKQTVRDVIGPDIFNRPIRSMYRTSLANVPEQTNPLEMISGAMKTTITGEGGIKSAHGITEDAKLVDPSHLGYLDPIHTPEGPSTGVTLRLPIGVKKRGHDVTIKMFNLKTGKNEDVNPEKAMASTVVLPDQVKWEKGKPVPIGKSVKMSAAGNDISEGPMKGAQYVMRDPIQMFSMASNLVPFVAADHPNRSTMAGRHMEQAIGLKDREAPLVQSMAGNKSFEQVMGSYAGHTSPVSGEVVKVGKDSITIKGADGKKHERQIYDHFPLNADKGFLTSTPAVKKGDKVKKGQSIADTNFTKDGTLALGTNLQVGYMPYKGYNFEDGIVISETAAKKLSSEHLHRKTLALDKGHILSKKKFQAYTPEALSLEQSKKLDDDGVAKAGQVVHPGDTLIAALREKSEYERNEDKELARMHKSVVKPYKDSSVKWEADKPGVVTEVVKRGRQTAVHVKTLEAAEIGDKLAGRHGNKGIITKIIPDDEMPKTKEGRELQILLNPTGVPGRTNLGQVLETAAGKIAEKTGKPYMVKNFSPDSDLHTQITQDLKKHGLTDKDEVSDPETGRPMGKILTGPQHIIKLKHQVEKKLVARAGGPGYAYDRNMIPKGGGPHGAQALGTLGLYSMLAHGAKENLREMQTLKSDAAQNDEFWSALQAGEPLPAPRPTFAYKKFTSYLNALGVNVKKEGNNLQLVPFTDAQVKDMSAGELKDAGRMVRAKDLRPEKSGLFDPKITGGVDGTKWSHMKLPEPFPNPLFEKAVQSLTNMTGKQFNDVIQGTKAIDPKTGKVITDVEKGMVGGKAFETLLKKVDVGAELAAAEKALDNPKLKGNRLDRANKKVKYLKALDSAGLKASDAYMMKNVPILPPSMRPLSQLPNGDLNVDDTNHMYKGIALSAKKLKEVSPLLPDEEKNEIRAEVYDGLRSLTGLGGHANREFRGIIDILGGKRPDRDTGKKVGQPKLGYFQGRLVQRKQDLSMRSTIIPEPDLGLDEVGIPRKAALELYKPFVVRELREMTGVSPLEAQQTIKDGGGLVNKALERVVENRPVLLKRDPALHKYSVQSFKPRIVGGKAVQIHPLVTSGFNADFDGDTMAAFVPVGSKAVDEARKMYPSRNLFSPATGDLMYKPTLETQLGLYGATQVGKKTRKDYKDIKAVESAVRKGEVTFSDQIKVGGLASTAGRFMVAGALPEKMRKGFLKRKEPLDKKGQSQLLTSLAKNHKDDYGNVVNRLKDLGNDWSTQSAFSIGLEDIKPEKILRQQVLAKADRQVARLTGTKKQRDSKAIQIYDKATQDLHRKINDMSEGQSKLLTMNRSGIKPGMDALRQIKMAPMLIANAKGETIPTPVKKSYSEGLDLADYWTSMSGARKGIIQKVQQVQEPGYLSKMVMNSVMNNSITDNDCGTEKGIALGVDEKDVLDRYLAADHKAGRKTFRAGTLVTPEIRSSLRNNKVSRVMVRSPMRCQHGPGICKKCYGLTEDGKEPEQGLNVGVLAGQSLGERATQLAMKAFHTGGTASSKEGLVDEFQRVKDLLLFPKTLPGSATLSTVNGTVSKVQQDPAGGHNVFVKAGDREVRHYVPQKRGVPTIGGKKLRRGAAIRKGAAISGGPVNPHQMLPLTGVEPVQGYLSGELHKIYGQHGIRRRNTEVVVKSLTNLTKVEDPGDQTEFIRGDYAPQSRIAALNRQMKKAKKGARPAVHVPILKGVNVLPLDMQEDWMARMNHQNIKSTVVDAAQQGWTSKLHGKHPIPPTVYGSGIGKGKPGEY